MRRQGNRAWRIVVFFTIEGYVEVLRGPQNKRELRHVGRPANTGEALRDIRQQGDKVKTNGKKNGQHTASYGATLEQRWQEYRRENERLRQERYQRLAERNKHEGRVGLEALQEYA